MNATELRGTLAGWDADGLTPGEKLKRARDLAKQNHDPDAVYWLNNYIERQESLASPGGHGRN